MNAYKLANELANNDLWIKDELAKEWTINMLRQQADRIAELEKFIKAILKKGGCDGNLCKRYDSHPVKQLSDEEIDGLMEFAGIRPSKEWGLATTGNVQLKIFARAIIKEITE